MRRSRFDWRGFSANADSMQFKIKGDDGSVLDATVELEGNAIVLRSRGGTRDMLTRKTRTMRLPSASYCSGWKCTAAR